MGSLQRQVSTLTQLTTSQELEGKRVHLSDDAKHYNNEIFKRIIAICPAWKQAFSTAQAAKDARREWLVGFSDAEGITSQTVEYALSKLRQRGNPFMPTIGEFVSWCDEGRLPAGTKNALESYSEMSIFNCLPREKREPSTLSAETYHTFSVICEGGNLSYYRSLPESKAVKYWGDRHAETLTRMKKGQSLKIAPPPSPKLEHTHRPASKSTALGALAAMRAGL